MPSKRGSFLADADPRSPPVAAIDHALKRLQHDRYT